MPGTNLIVPVVLWGKHAPTHCISSVYLSRDQKTLVTGCYDGQICIWQVEPETLKMTPRCLLVGHTAPVTCLSRASIIQDNNFIVSSSEAGEMCTWDLVDGKCRESVKLTQVHTNIQAYHMCNSDDLRLFCNGYYAEILIMDPFSLEILFSLSSKMNPDWISALHVLRPSSRKDDVVLAISITGTVKVWSLLGHENKQSEPIYENESKQIRCLNALSLNCCAYNQRTVLIVCAKYCQIYDAGDFSVLCSIQAPSGERWMSGDFLAPDKILVWSTEGKGYLYKLPANKLRGRAISSSVPDHKGFHGPTVEHDSPVLFSMLAHPDNKLLSCPPAMRFILTSAGGKQKRLLLRGDSAGVVSLWNVDDALAIVAGQAAATFAPIVLTSLEMAWAEMNPSPVGILDQFSHPEEPEVKLTASIYLLAANRLVVGREDGSIVIVNATHTVQLQLLHGNHQQLDDLPLHQLLLGHIGRVNCLLYPHHVHHRYDKSHLVSGGIDFAVCLWDLFSGALLHRFCVHAGEITQLIVPPQNCSPRIQKCICAVASDHSVTLLSLAERKCVTLASRHLFPVVTIKWRPLDDFMVVGCSDGTVYVWQMETGHLDRVLHGMIAEEVLAACDETLENELGGAMTSGTDLQGLANPALHFFRGLRHRNLNAMRAATQRGLAALQAADRSGNAGPLAEPARARRAPLTIQGFRSNPADPESHILFFDIEGLIVELLSEEYSAMSPASLEAAGLITSEYMKVAALTQSASPDAAKRISGILAKMKEGAETMQTKLQAKADQIKSHLEPKGGGPSKHFFEEPAIQKVLELIQTRVSGFINIYDSDSTHVIAGGGSGNGDVRVAPSSVEHLTLCDQNHAQNPDSSDPMVLEITSTQTLTTVTGPNWSQYSPSMLRDFRNPVLGPSPPPPDVQLIDQQTNLSPNPQNFIHSPRFHTRVPTTSPAATSRRRPTLRRDRDVNAHRVEILAQSSEYAQEEHTIKKQLLEQEVLKLKLVNEHALEEHAIRMQILRHQEQQEQLKLKQEALKVELLELQIKKLKD